MKNIIFVNTTSNFRNTQSFVNDPYNPMRLFANEPQARPVVKKEEKSLRNKVDGSFVVIASDLDYAQALIAKAQANNLTVSGDSTCKVGKGLGSIKNIEKGNLISFGTSERFDINWIARRSYAYENGLVPVYDIVKDWITIQKALAEFSADKKEKVTKYLDDLKKSIRPEVPTYRTLRLMEEGKKVVTEKKQDVISKFEGKTTSQKVVGVMPGSNFIKVGYKIIPVKQVNIQPTYEVRFRPVVNQGMDIEVILL